MHHRLGGIRNETGYKQTRGQRKEEEKKVEKRKREREEKNEKKVSEKCCSLVDVTITIKAILNRYLFKLARRQRKTIEHIN